MSPLPLPLPRSNSWREGERDRERDRVRERETERERDRYNMPNRSSRVNHEEMGEPSQCGRVIQGSALDEGGKEGNHYTNMFSASLPEEN